MPRRPRGGHGHGNVGAVAREAAANGTRGIAACAPERGGGGGAWPTCTTTRRSGGTVTPYCWGAEEAFAASSPSFREGSGDRASM